MIENLGGASFSFLGFSAVVALAYNLRASAGWRQAVLLIASLAFLSGFSSQASAYLPLAGFLAFGFLGLELAQSKSYSKWLPALISATVLAFIWLKKYTFVPPQTYLRFPYVTLGLSYIFFRVLHLLIEAKEGSLPGRVTAVQYLNYTLNFTTLVSGPIQRYQDFEAMHLAEQQLPLNIGIAGPSLERIIIGFFKVNVLSLFLSSVQHQAIAELVPGLTLDERSVRAIVIGCTYPLYLYCNFSGYIDIVIGIARFLRIELPENFNRPFASENFMIFWSRWHITLSQWLKTYVYNPVVIVLMRSYSSPAVEPFLGVFAFFVTFFLVGVWHGQTSEFLFFGVLQGGGVSAVKLYQVLMTRWIGKKRYKALSNVPIYNAFARGLTFTWFAFTLLWFWSNWPQLEALARSLGVGACALAGFVTFLLATLVLSAWEALRGRLLEWKWRGTPVLTTRYVRTAWGTALAVVAIAVLMLLNSPAPDIVYKAF